MHRMSGVFRVLLELTKGNLVRMTRSTAGMSMLHVSGTYQPRRALRSASSAPVCTGGHTPMELSGGSSRWERAACQTSSSPRIPPCLILRTEVPARYLMLRKREATVRPFVAPQSARMGLGRDRPDGIPRPVRPPD